VKCRSIAAFRFSSYHDETVRVASYRKGDHTAIVQKSATLLEETVRHILRQCGVTGADLEAVMALCKAPDAGKRN
jgi:hypothetical protein